MFGNSEQTDFCLKDALLVYIMRSESKGYCVRGDDGRQTILKIDSGKFSNIAHERGFCNFSFWLKKGMRLMGFPIKMEPAKKVVS